MKELLRETALRAAGSTPFHLVLSLLERLPDENPHLLRVITYHRVDRPEARPWLTPGILSATPEQFEEQVRLLARRYRVLAMGEVLQRVREGEGLPPRTVLITFDDAYRDFAEHAWPALRRAALPATLFVPTAFPGDPGRRFWWDALYHALGATTRKEAETAVGRLGLETRAGRSTAYARLVDRIKSQPHAEAMGEVERLCTQLDVAAEESPVLGWQELRQLAGEGLVLAPHTRTHPMMDRISPAEAREEVSGSLADLEREVGETLPVFAYPSGQLSPEAVEVVKGSGIELAFTTAGGINDLRSAEPLRLRRINVTHRGGTPVLRPRLLAAARRLNRWIPLPG